MAEARIPEKFGDTQIRVRVLDFMGLGLRMPREAWRLPSPQTLHWDANWLCNRLIPCVQLIVMNMCAVSDSQWSPLTLVPVQQAVMSIPCSCES